MNRTIAGLTSALIAAGLWGCGGGGSTPAITNSPFAGHYVGTFNDTTAGQSGTLNITVAADGTIAGTSDNTTAGVNSTITGSVSNAGTDTLVFTFPGGQETASGTVAFDSQGHLAGNESLRYNGNTDSATFNLVRQ
ncbi:MAG: hypothetical protein LC772_06840 [Chloroflexi bacterium]|nr:hypothetical protein [Chloroflexota bacterium]